MKVENILDNGSGLVAEGWTSQFKVSDWVTDQIIQIDMAYVRCRCACECELSHWNNGWKLHQLRCNITTNNILTARRESHAVVTRKAHEDYMNCFVRMMVGDKKLKHLVTGKFVNPRCFENISSLTNKSVNNNRHKFQWRCCGLLKRVCLWWNIYTGRKATLFVDKCLYWKDGQYVCW